MPGSQTEIRLPTSAPLASARSLRTPHAQPRHLAGPPQLRSLSARRRPSSGAGPSPALPAASPLPAGRQARADSRPSLPPQPRQLCQARRGWGPQAVPAPREPAVPGCPPARAPGPCSPRPACPARSAAPRAAPEAGPGVPLPRVCPSGSVPPFLQRLPWAHFSLGLGSLGLRHLLASASLTNLRSKFPRGPFPRDRPCPLLARPLLSGFPPPEYSQLPGRPGAGARCRRGGAVLPAPGACCALTSSCLRRRK